VKRKIARHRVFSELGTEIMAERGGFKGVGKVHYNGDGGLGKGGF
jgi:hypothetical protein